MIAARPQHRALTLAVLAVTSLMSEAGAQESRSGKSPEREKEATTLDTMVVTAQKREEVLQDVPIMLTALPEQILRDSGVRDVKDVQLLVPGLHVSSTTNESQTTARIRGVGTNGDNAGLESAVGVVIDGVYRPRVGVGFGDLGEIERIEVLKGPQGTVFGKNTSAGVINVITRRPNYTQNAEGEITIGNYGAVGVSGAYNDALSETAAFRIYAAKRKRDGFLDVRTGHGPREETDDVDQNFHSLRGQLLLEPNDNLDINFIGDYTSREEHCCAGVTIIRGPTADAVDRIVGGPGQGVILEADPERHLAYANRSTKQDIKDKGVSAEINWTTPWFRGATLTSITALRDWKSINGRDLDFTAGDGLYQAPTEDGASSDFKTFSQELRLTGSTDKIDWMVGFFYSDEDLDRREGYSYGVNYEDFLSEATLIRLQHDLAAAGSPSVVNMTDANLFLSQATGLPYGTSFAGGAGSRDRHQQKAKSAALFTNNTWHATDKLDFTLGLRYTREKKDLHSNYVNPDNGAACKAVEDHLLSNALGALLARGLTLQEVLSVGQVAVGMICVPWQNYVFNGKTVDQSREEKEWSGTLKASYRWNEHLMTYASAARGYKAGGYNLDRESTPNPLGITAPLQGQPLILMDADTSFPGEFVDSYELGGKSTWLGGNLLLNATLFYQEFTDFQLNSFLGTSYVVRSIPKVTSKGIDTEVNWQSTSIKGLSLQGGVTYADTRYGKDKLPDADLWRLPGSHISFAPLWSASASATYQWDFGGDLIGRFNVGAKYMSEHNTGSDLDPEKIQSGYALVNARLGIGAKNQRWMVELWGQNLGDKTYKQVAFDAPLQIGSWNTFLGAPRTYGVTLRVQY